MKFSKYFDHTLLKPDATEDQIIKLCREALHYDFYSVCVNGAYVPLAADQLKDSDIKVAAVIGFPLGAMSCAAKMAEAADALENGASELDMVLNIGALKDGRDDLITAEISRIAALCHEKQALLKVILETCLLTEEEIIRACQLCVKGGADFVKTSTGFSTGGAVAADVALMKKTVCGKAQVKASGGIRTLADAMKFIEAGADRLGCSAGVSIMEERKHPLGS